MAYDALIEFIENTGYIAFFLAMCGGIFGLPIPNEVVVMTAGGLSASGYMGLVPSFVWSYAGICSGLSSGYLIGRFAGGTLLQRMNRKKGMQRFIGASQELSRKYGSYAIVISLFIPVLRHVTPYAVGMNRMPYRSFAAFAYAAALVWTTVYYLIGTFLGEHIRSIGNLISRYGIVLLLAIAAGAAVYFVWRRTAARRKASRPDRESEPKTDL